MIVARYNECGVEAFFFHDPDGLRSICMRAGGFFLDYDIRRVYTVMSADVLQLLSSESVADRGHQHRIRIAGFIQVGGLFHPALVAPAEDDDDVGILRFIRIVMVEAVCNDDTEQRDEKQQYDEIKFTVHLSSPSAYRSYFS